MTTSSSRIGSAKPRSVQHEEYTTSNSDMKKAVDKRKNGK